MEEETEIPEEISERLEALEEVDEPIYTDDEDLEKDIDITHEIHADEPETGDYLDKDVLKCEVITDNTGIHKTNGVNIIIPDAVDPTTIAVLQFSDNLAESILKEAVLITDIYTKDTLNVETNNNGANGRINFGNGTTGRKLPGPETGNGCDRYLLEKLLRSQPDMDDTPVVYEGFNGDEVNFKSDLDEGDAGRPEARDKGLLEVSDKNNNQMDANTISMLSDNFLETIHEDTELILNRPDENPETPKNTPRDTPRDTPRETSGEHVTKVEHRVHIEIKDDGDHKTKEHEGFRVDTETEKSETEYHTDMTDDESEDEIDCCEMTYKEKRAVVKAVRRGDIDKVEILLEKRNADLDLVWYGENLLMIAIRADQESMAEFLIDNNIDLTFTGRLMERSEDGDMTVFTFTARQLAFDKGMDDIVEVIDFKTNNLFPFVKPKERDIRLRRPRPPTPSPTPEEEMDEDIFYDPEEDICLLNNPNDQGSEMTGSHKDFDSKQSHASRSRQGHRAQTHTSGTSKFEDESEVTVPSVSRHSEIHSEIQDDISHVFGQDEGYETMSPVSPVAPAPNHKLERNFLGTKEHVSVRGTRSSHSLKIRNSASRSRSSSDSDSVQDYVMYPIQTLGSYNHERKRWQQTKSAPVRRNLSVESIPDTAVRLGFPFVHGQTDRSNISSAKSDTRQRSQSARSNLSPFSQVARLLSESKLLNTSSSSSVTHLPEMKTEPLVKRKDTRTSYTCIYANTSALVPGRTIYSHPGYTSKPGFPDLQGKKKLRA